MSTNDTTSTTFDSDGRVFTREVEFAVSPEGDGRTLSARIVPYNVQARVADPPLMVPYTEMFMPGAFRAQMTAPNRIDVLLNFEHRQGISDVVGRGVQLYDRTDGLHADFRIVNHPDGDKALELVHSGVLRGMSAEFKAKRSQTVDGVVQRVDARVGNVALCRDAGSPFVGPKAAYAGAEILSVRTEDNPEEAEVLLVVPAAAPIDADLAERLNRLGVEPLLVRTVVRKPWDGAASRFTDEEYQRSCLLCRGGDAPPKERCSLPVLEPNGDLNANALGAAAAALRGARGALAGVSAEAKAAAARKLVRLYRQAQMTPPPGIVTLAG